jgi:3'-phosphoadenosine 5'-phosphosulfate sulfotransferase (PAPS reductase)/FAD synthetase
MFPGPQPGPEEIIAKALSFKPVAIFAGYSGGDDSLATAHWMMANVPGCEILHINTGIGIEATRRHVRETCAAFSWPLTEMRAKEDCGIDYDALVRAYGFPGPAVHYKMYRQLKERAIRKVVASRRRKYSREKVMIATGIRQDESQRRMGYGGNEVNFVGSQMWVNPLYWQPKSWFMDYIAKHDLPRSPVSKMLGMSGECLCGAFAHAGEKALVRIVCPETADRLDRLEAEVRAAGHNWGWEDRPPRPAKPPREPKVLAFRPMCVGCEKTGDLFEDAA